VPNPDGFLTPGLFGHMRLLGSKSYTGQLLPDSAVVTDQNRDVVYVVTGGKIAERVVRTGPLVDGLRVVRSGLSSDDLVVLAGSQKAKPGQAVKVKPGVIAPPDDGPAKAPYILPPSSSAQVAEGRGAGGGR
jgi:hypothetical protein